MQVAFHLRRRPESAPATALLLTSHEAADLLRLGARLGCDPLPPVYAVADGFLVKLPRPSGDAFPGAIRLRGLADNLLLPVDAELLPALLPDEAAALGRQRGLVFLPGGRVLEFDPARPVPLSTLLSGGGLRREAYSTLPEPAPLADRLREITLEQPEETPEDILEQGREEIGTQAEGDDTGTEDGAEGAGTEGAEPDSSSMPARALGRAAYTFGKSLVRLGQALGLKGLSARGAKWMAAALSLVPRLREALLGKQEAALRALLRDFRTGQIERALRRALPLGGDFGRGSAPFGGTHLPTHNLLYSLGNILAGSGQPADLWFANLDLHQELTKEYRKQAELAAERGDYRRAAFIYGQLLQDYRSAALVLSRGGLHRDAAVLYLKKLNDQPAAAVEYEAAGEILTAPLQLYRQMGKHALAGDLLRRAGEEELAVAEYLLAADKLVASGQGHYQAGELLRTRAGRADLALPHYEAGWWQRPAGTPVPCALRMAQGYVDSAAADLLLALVKEADDFLLPPGNDGPAGEFYNEVARLADRLSDPEVQDSLRDRALVGLAGKIRHRARQSFGSGVTTLVSGLLGASQAWTPAVVSDAQFAVTHGGAPPGPARLAGPTVTTVIRARIARVSAVCQAPQSGDVFLGFESGEVVCYRPLFGEVATLANEEAPVVSLATSEDGDTLVVLSGQGPRGRALRTYARSVGYRMVAGQVVETGESPWLCPLLVSAGEPVVGLWTGEAMDLLQAQALVFRTTWDLAPGDVEPDAGALLVNSEGLAGLGLLAGDGLQVFLAEESQWGSVVPLWRHLGWRPHLVPGSTLRRPALSWLFLGAGKVELAGIGADGQLYVSTAQFQNGAALEVDTKAWAPAGLLQAVAMLRPRQFAAVMPTGVAWLRWEHTELRVLHTTSASLPGAVACFHHHRAQELIVVCGDGTVARLPAVYG